MQCLNQNEQKAWLQRQGIPENPYGVNPTHKFYIQFYSPQTFRPLQYFIDAYLEHFLNQSSALVVVTDWESNPTFEMNLLETFRLAHGEKRPLIETSGHLFTAAQRNDIVGVFSVATGLGWTSYLYLPDQKTTLYNWEGEIMDFWTNSSTHHKTMTELIGRFKLKETPKKKV